MGHVMGLPVRNGLDAQPTIYADPRHMKNTLLFLFRFFN
jgi:hypothetical protein